MAVMIVACAIPILVVTWFAKRTIENKRENVKLRLEVGKLAEEFGGGGHKNAAGASFEGKLADVQKLTLTAIRNLMAARDSATS